MSGNDIDRMLADWFEADALAQAPADGVEGALAGARRRTPRPAWLAGPGSHWVGDSVGPASGAATLGRTSVRPLVALLLLLLVLALVSGAVLVGARLVQPAPPTVPLVAGQLVLHLESWQEERNEVAVYADGRVIWGPDAGIPYLEQRLTHEGLERLRSRALSTGLFERDLLAIGTDVVGSGYIKVLRGNRPVIVAWGSTPGVDVSGGGVRYVRASSAQAAEVTALEAYVRDPAKWGLPDNMYGQPEIEPFVPSHLWVGFDRSVPILSNLPSPAREILTRALRPSNRPDCELISIAEAQEIAQALAGAGILEPDYEVRRGFAFDEPGSHSFVHIHPALPHDVAACTEG